MKLKVEEISQFLQKDEKILWKKCQIFNYYKDGMRNLIILLLIIIGISFFIFFIMYPFNVITIVVSIIIILSIFIIIVPFLNGVIRYKKQRKLLSKEELKNYCYCSIITNKRFIQKHITNFNRDETATHPLIYSEYVDDIFSIRLNDIDIIGTDFHNDSYCELYIYSEINFEFPPTTYIPMTLEELINAIKIFNELLQFEQEEHHINAGIIYFRTKQVIPEKYLNLFRYEENKIKPLQDVIKIKEN